jgi:hypothetical protein
MHVSPMILRLISVSDHTQLPGFHDIFRLRTTTYPPVKSGSLLITAPLRNRASQVCWIGKPSGAVAKRS